MILEAIPCPRCGRPTNTSSIPTPAQVQQLEETLWRCRTLYNVALEQRITLWKQRGVTLTRYEQEAELKDLRAGLPRIRRHPLPCLAGCAGAPGPCLSSLLPAGPRRSNRQDRQKSGLSPLPGPLRAIAIIASPGRNMATGCGWTTVSWCCQDRTDRRPLESSVGRHPQDHHHQPRKPTAGMSSSRVPRCLSSPALPPDRDGH